MLKKSMALLLVVFTVLITVSSALPVFAAKTGDVNSDNLVNSIDYLKVKRYVLGTGTLSSSEKSRADVDGDGVVDRIDFVMIKRIALGTLESSFNTANKTGISYSKSYTTSRPAGGSGSNYNSNYDDTYDQELTDGCISVAADYLNESLCGFDGSVDIYINLGSAGVDICGFELSYLNTADAGIYSPESLTVYGGNSKNACNTQLGFKKIIHSSVTDIRSVSIDLNNTVDYSYIRFSIEMDSSAGAWIFIDEAIVYGIVDNGGSSVSDHYAADTLTDSNRASYLSSAASGATYNASAGTTVISKNCSYSFNHSSYDSRLTYKNSILTNGVATGSHFSSDAWVGLNAKTATTVTLNLSSYSAITDVCGFAIHCFNRPTASIKLPDYVDISVSPNGSTYYTVGRVYAPDNNQENYSYSLFLKTLVSAKYVKFSFPSTNGYIWIEEIEVYANRSAGTSSTSTTGYLGESDNVLGGAGDIALIYHNNGVVDEEMLLPYVAYLDENGNVLDTMFDGYLFLPKVGTIKTDGSTPYGTNYAEDWLWLFDELFTEGKNLDALNKTAEKVKFLLGKSNFKLQVYITIPHMDPGLSNFGDLNGDGVSENLTSQNNRVNVAKYYAQKVIDEFNSKKYANLEIGGFYWFHEAISGSDVNTAKAVNSAFDQMGVQLFWIPYFNAEGFLNGYNYGFDAVCLQPNYAFALDTPETQLQTAASYARQKGYCLEIEIAPGSAVDRRYFQKYVDYLSGGIKYGYMNNSIHMYYQAFDDIGITWKAEGRARLIYEYTYQFIKGTLDVTPSNVSAMSFNASKNTKFGGMLNLNGTDERIYKLATSPSHGSLSFADDGSFVYYPNKGFTGTDTFTYKIGNYLGWSTECTVTIKVN